MFKYNYINGIKAYDKVFYDNLQESIKLVWGNKGDLRQIYDDIDFIECHPEIDRKDTLECDLQFNTDTIKVADILSFSKKIGVSPDKMEIKHNIDEKLSLYWEEEITHP